MKQTIAEENTFKREKSIIAILMLLYPILGMGIDLIAPSLPAITHNLQVSAGFSKNLITIYLFGLVLGNFFIGFLSDALGRRKLIIAGFIAFVIASLLPPLFPNTMILLLSRFLQGAALGTFVVTARGILTDVLTVPKIIKTAPMLAIMWGIGPIIGPIIGGYLQFYFNWQACFYFFAAYGLLALIGVFLIIPETHFNRQPLKISQIRSNFKEIISHRVFIGMVTLMGIFYASLVVFNSLCPFLIQTELGYSPIFFGKVALAMGISLILGNTTCRLLVKYYESEMIIKFAVLLALSAAVIGLVAAYIEPRSMLTIIIPTFIVIYCCGVIYPTCLGKSMSLFRHLGGSSSAVMNLINISITCLTGLIMSFVNADSAVPLNWMYVILALLGGVCFWNLVYGSQSSVLSSET